ncbi:DUF1015 domain-containing protein [Nonomuraea wenchangensis]|uniref:DUF1015 domain-containing protein n=1 Tax=Nonomuraea wenchangensis TaxID=568860 RepID=UPI0033D0921F
MTIYGSMPGMGTPELPVPDGLVLRPFRGVRFAVEDPAKVTSPPYDLISDADVDTLLHLHPNNVVRLILPRTSRPGPAHPLPPTPTLPAAHTTPAAQTVPATDTLAADDEPPPETRYAEARDTLQAWLHAGILVPDDRPALYVYEQHGPHFLQRGLIGDVALTDPGQHVILPHEDVMPGPIADRLALMSTTQANLEPIFLLYDGAGGPTTRLVEEVATRRRPLVSAKTEDGVTHRLWAITDTSEIATINADLHDRQALIADGHHRYATYRVLQRQERLTHPPAEPSSTPSDTTPRGMAPDKAASSSAMFTSSAAMPGGGTAAGPSPAHSSSTDDSHEPPSTTLVAPWDFGLALLVDSTAYPPDLKAIHRVIPGLPLAKAAAQARQSWRVQEFGTLAEGLTAFENSPDPAFLLADATGAYLITDPDPVQLARAMPADHSDRWNSLNTSILSEFILPKVWGMRDDEQAVRIVHHDIEAAAELATSTGGTAVILKPLATEDVLAVAADGERVPRKSTSFGPKPRTGLVLRTFAIN